MACFSEAKNVKGVLLSSRIQEMAVCEIDPIMNQYRIHVISHVVTFSKVYSSQSIFNEIRVYY